MTDITAVRAFNRFYTRRMGVLQYDQITAGLSLSEARVMYELAHAQTLTSSRLVAALEIDPGYLSRILRRFEERGWIARKPSKEDARTSLIRLTKSGANKFALLNERSNEHVEAVLNTLSGDEKQRLLQAMSTVQKLLGDESGAGAGESVLVLRTHEPGDIGWIIQRHGETYAREYGWDITFEALVAEIALSFVRNFDASRERCWIAERDGQRLGTIMCVKSEDEHMAKLRLLLVEPSARGLGLGRRLVRECIRFARSCGYRRVTLWTNSVLHSARKIYEAEGFALVKEEPHHSFGHSLLGQFWELAL